MKRTVEFFIRKGVVIKSAPTKPNPEAPNPDDLYGQIVLADCNGAIDQEETEKQKDIMSLPAGDKKKVCSNVVYTHTENSFTDKFIQPGVDNTVYFFLIPMEYFFSDEKLPGTVDNTPMLAVNVTPTFPQIVPIGNNPCTRHPCTFATTVKGDSFDDYYPPEMPSLPLQSSIFPINPFSYYWRKSFFHPRRRWLYGINDYGELEIIDISEDDIKGNNIKPWSKILLRTRKHPEFEHYHRRYSPKRKERRDPQFKILVQKFDRIDPDWKWNIYDK